MNKKVKNKQWRPGTRYPKKTIEYPAGNSKKNLLVIWLKGQFKECTTFTASFGPNDDRSYTGCIKGTVEDCKKWMVEHEQDFVHGIIPNKCKSRK